MNDSHSQTKWDGLMWEYLMYEMVPVSLVPRFSRNANSTHVESLVSFYVSMTSSK